MKHLGFIALLCLIISPCSLPAFAQPASNEAPSPRAVEDDIATLINDYRRSLGLPPVPRSSALDRVARAHVQDLASYHPDQGVDSRGIACNAHSWSSHGNWRPVCYTADHAYAAGMWAKPSEVTGGAYNYPGYEIAMGSTGSVFSAQVAVSGWQASPAHNAVIAEQGIWAGARWQAMGVGVGPGYAVIWFAKVPDTGGH